MKPLIVLGKTEVSHTPGEGPLSEGPGQAWQICFLMVNPLPLCSKVQFTYSLSSVWDGTGLTPKGPSPVQCRQVAPSCCQAWPLGSGNRSGWEPALEVPLLVWVGTDGPAGELPPQGRQTGSLWRGPSTGVGRCEKS